MTMIHSRDCHLSVIQLAALCFSFLCCSINVSAAATNDGLQHREIQASSRWARRREFMSKSASVPEDTRTLFMFGSMDDWISRQQQQTLYRSPGVTCRDSVLLARAGQSRSRRTLASSSYSSVEDDDSDDEDDENIYDYDVKGEDIESSQFRPPPQETKRDEKQSKMWPPYPFNLLQRVEDGTDRTVRRGPAIRAGGVVWTFFQQRVRVSGKQLQDVTSRLWFHLPPSIPPLILLTLIPRQEQQLVTNIETGMEQMVSKTVVPLISNPLARGLVLGGVSLAILSWAHSELNRLKKLTPLPLNEAYRGNIHRAVLPTFLPEEVPDPYMLEGDDLSSSSYKLQREDSGNERGASGDPQATSRAANSTIPQKLLSSVPPSLQKHFKQFGSSSDNTKSKRTPIKNLKRVREARRRESQKIRRMQIYDELVALQAIKHRSKQEQKQRNRKFGKNNNHKGNADDEEPLGYALVTGASRGIGRAIAVELARWEIPLILVARDLPRLTALAYDLEACYGIKCCVLQADLSQPNAADQIHQATTSAGLDVDILVNNAGVSFNGLAVDTPMSDVERAIMINVNSVAKLTHFYGKDMKEKRRGRILMVSSVVGAVSAGPTVALYAATKSFEKMLGLSIAKELEPYGVGLTCLMPGAVKDTDFRVSSKTHEALCWKLPLYPTAPSKVAAAGIRALLRGDAEVTPGILNRVFLKVLKPGMPQRLHNVIVEMAWNPPQVPPFLAIWQSAETRQKARERQLEQRNKDGHEEAQYHDEELKRSELQEKRWQPRYNSAARGAPPPLMLMVPGEKGTSEKPAEPAPATKPMPPSNSIGVPEPSMHDSNEDHEDQGTASEPDPLQSQTSETEGDKRARNDEYSELRRLPDSNVREGEQDYSTRPDANGDAAGSPGTTSNQQHEQHYNQPHSPQQQPQSNSQLSQLQEQVQQLQQKVQEQERQQFLQQLEQQRKERELERERHELEKQRQREEEQARQKQEEAQEEKSRPQQKRKKRTETKHEGAKEQPQNTDRDILTESLEHPLLS